MLSYQDLGDYFNAKKNVSLPQIFVRVNKDSDEVELERSRSRESALEVTFGLKVRVQSPARCAMPCSTASSSRPSTEVEAIAR